MKKYSILTLDWDISFEDYRDSVSWAKLKQWLREGRAKAVYVRRSAFGNTHVKIVMKRKIDEYELLKTRAKLRDDIYRLKMDLVRAYDGLEINRLWDSKVENGELKKAGEWVKVRQNINKSGGRGRHK